MPEFSPELKISSMPKVYWSSAYFIAVATLYLWGYWSAFHINILEYVGLTDVVKTAAYPIASAFAFMAFGAILGEILFPHGLMPEGGGANTRVGRALKTGAPFLTALFTLGLVLLLIYGPIRKWLVLPLLFAVPASLALKKSGFLEDVIPSDRARSVVLFLLAALPPYAYGHGVVSANQILDGSSYTYIASPIEGYSMDSSTNSDRRPRYIGRAGESYFLFDSFHNAVLVVPQSSIKVLELIHKERPSEPQEPARATSASKSVPLTAASSPAGATSKTSSPQ